MSVAACCPECYRPSVCQPVDSIERGQAVKVFTCTSGHTIIGPPAEIEALLLDSDEGSKLMDILQHHQVPPRLPRVHLVHLIGIAKQAAAEEREFQALVAPLEQRGEG